MGGAEGKEMLGSYLSILPFYWRKRPLPKSLSSPRSLLDLAAKVKNNSFAIMDTESHTDVGTGLYLSCNLLNHSCRPNCVVTFTDAVMSVHTIRFVHQKEELRTIYGFDCECFACSQKLNDDRMLQDFDGKTMSISKRLTARQLIADLDRLHKEGSHDDIHELCESYIKRETLPKHTII